MRVLFLDAVHPVLEARLHDAGWECVHDLTCSYDELKNKVHLFDGLIIRSRLPIDAQLVRSAGRLKFIARSGSGLENIDLDATAQAGIQVFNSPEGNRDAVGEQAIGMLLMLLNHLRRADAEVRSGRWLREANRGGELAGKTVGIIGYGNMGTAFAEKLQGFNCSIIAYDKYRQPSDDDLITMVSLAELLRRADIISLHIPETPETIHLIDDAFIVACSKPFVLINTSRGINVDTAALVRGLESGAVSGACLDVLEYEKSSFEGLNSDDFPSAFRYLVASDRVVLSPHIAGWTVESYIKLSAVLADKVLTAFGA